jgi:hypothetical protein
LLANFAGVSFAIFLVKTSLAGNVNADWRRGAMRRAACDGGCCCINITIFAFFKKLYGLLMG